MSEKLINLNPKKLITFVPFLFSFFQHILITHVLPPRFLVSKWYILVSKIKICLLEAFRPYEKWTALPLVLGAKKVFDHNYIHISLAWYCLPSLVSTIPQLSPTIPLSLSLLTLFFITIDSLWFLHSNCILLTSMFIFSFL